jgi:hypothetical protein
MKYLLVIAGMLSVGTVIAQNPNITQDRLKKFKSNVPVLKAPLLKPFISSDPYSVQKAFASTDAYVVLANGNKMYRLSQDNMPCIVPDIMQYSMPNLADKKINPQFYFDPYGIPNPALPNATKPVIPPDFYFIPQKKDK